MSLKLGFSARVFENRVLRNIFGPKDEDVTRRSSKSDNEERHSSFKHHLGDQTDDGEMGRTHIIFVTRPSKETTLDI